MTDTQEHVGSLALLDQAHALIKPNAADWAPDAFKTLMAMVVPGIGPLVAFAIEQRPETQLKRMAAYLNLLHPHVVRMAGDLDGLMRDWDKRPEAASVLSTGLSAAAAATSESRLKRLAVVSAEGLTADERAAMDVSRVLKVLAEIDDGEFEVLTVVERERRIFVCYGDAYSWKSDATVQYLQTEPSPEPPALPKELASWPVSNLSMALNHLAGLGLVEGEASQLHHEQVFRSFVATPAGGHLVGLCDTD